MRAIFVTVDFVIFYLMTIIKCRCALCLRDFILLCGSLAATGLRRVPKSTCARACREMFARSPLPAILLISALALPQLCWAGLPRAAGCASSHPPLTTLPFIHRLRITAYRPALLKHTRLHITFTG